MNNPALERIQATFNRLGYPQLNSKIKCESIDGRIYLSGTIDSYYLKQIAQSVAIQVAGFNRVENNIKISEEYESLIYQTSR